MNFLLILDKLTSFC